MFVYNTPSILLLPVVQSIIGLVWCVTWALSITFLISQVPDSYTPTGAYATYAEAFGTEDSPGACTDKWPTGFFGKTMTTARRRAIAPFQAVGSVLHHASSLTLDLRTRSS